MLTDWFCGRDRLGLTLRQITLYVQRYLARKVQFSSIRDLSPGFQELFPEAVTGWTTMVVTAAVYLEFEDPNGGITN
jgi:hypothetical protein